MSLTFDGSRYEILTVEREGKTVVCRAFEHIPYVENPADAQMQCLSLYVPECYYEGKTINGYGLKNAPVFMPNTVGGYMPGPEERPGENFMHETNATFYALLHGYVVAAPGVRGRGMKNADGRNIGIAPAHIVDLKAAVRYLKYNRERIPGDAGKIISNGTSAGGAISSLLGSTGNHPDYAPYLRELGAADADDSIFAASCYCPITNLDHADMAYEWEFEGRNDFHRMQFNPPAPGETRPRMTPVDGQMTEQQKAMASDLKAMFPAYLNSLDLKDREGYELTLDPDGRGTFRDYTAGMIMASAQKELDRLKAGRPGDSTVGEKYEGLRHSAPNTVPEPKQCPAFVITNGTVEAVDLDAFVKFRTRMKETPAFDNTALGTPENELFGSPDIQYRHFTQFSQSHDTANGTKADAMQVRMMNPMNYIDDAAAVKAEHFRIRHGAVDRDTSLAISEMLALKLKNAGVDCDLAHPWGIPHAGDYDLDELFGWIDGICGQKQN